MRPAYRTCLYRIQVCTSLRAMTSAPGAPEVVAGPRRYRSQLREQQAEQTKRAVLQAAHDLFVTQGWAATGMREVAATAGVALETVYSHFSSKRGLLRAVADAAVAGDDAPVPLAQRPEFLAMGRGRRAARVRAAARLVTAVHLRTVPIAKLLREAAHADAEIAGMLTLTRDLQRRDVATALDLILGRPPAGAERDGVWAMVSPEVYLLLIEESGWTPEQYETWLAATLERVIPRP
jgi:AcrR family transcriptional regulator